MFYKNTELYNVAEFAQQDNKQLLTRIPDSLRITLETGAKGRALWTAGCEIRFNLKSESAKIVLQVEKESILPIAEVYQGCFKIENYVIQETPTTITIKKPAFIKQFREITKQNGLPFDPHLTRIILPHLSITKIIDIEGDVCLPEKNQTPATRYLAYGSSITHGSRAVRPTGTYAMQTARLLQSDLINLGFGGGAVCEPQLADYIAGKTNFDFATLELGINMIGAFETEEFRKRIEYFIPAIANAHPEKWIFCIDLFPFYADFNHSSTKQNEFRNAVKATVKNLNMPKVVHIDGREILRNPAGLMGDLVHPSPEGMDEMARNLSEIIKDKI